LSLPQNYRGIAIAEALSKIYTTVLKIRLSLLYEDLAPEFANGFRRGRSRADSISAVMDTLRLRKSHDLDSYLILFDVVKCFDRIKRTHIWKSMSKMGVCPHMINAVRSTLENTTAVLHVEGEQRTVLVHEGTGQGTTLGPTLCNFFMLPLLLHWQLTWTDRATVLHHDMDKTTVSHLHNFADDMAIISATREDAERTASQLYEFLQGFLVDLHVATQHNPHSKSVVIHIPARPPQHDAPLPPPLIVDNFNHKSIAFVSQAKYLGHIISSSLSDDAHIKARMAKASQVFGALRPLLLGKKEVWKTVKARVLETMIIPTMLDGFECCATTKRNISDMETLYHRFVRSCLHVTPHSQRIHRWTSEQLLQRLRVFPLHYYMDLKTLSYAGHVSRMPCYRLPRIVRDSTLWGTRRVGRPTRTVVNNIDEALKRKRIPSDTWHQSAAHRGDWATLIRQHHLRSAKAFPPKHRRDPAWVLRPASIVGAYVEELFRRQWFVGRIIRAEFDPDDNSPFWTVRFDGGDDFVYNAAQLQDILGDNDLEELI
jgi:hypothetical protein